jgi:hypothetical protein
MKALQHVLGIAAVTVGAILLMSWPEAVFSWVHALGVLLFVGGVAYLLWIHGAFVPFKFKSK